MNNVVTGHPITGNRMGTPTPTSTDAGKAKIMEGVRNFNRVLGEGIVRVNLWL